MKRTQHDSEPTLGPNESHTVRMKRTQHDSEPTLGPNESHTVWMKRTQHDSELLTCVSYLILTERMGTVRNGR